MSNKNKIEAQFTNKNLNSYQNWISKISKPESLFIKEIVGKVEMQILAQLNSSDVPENLQEKIKEVLLNHVKLYQTRNANFFKRLLEQPDFLLISLFQHLGSQKLNKM